MELGEIKDRLITYFIEQGKIVGVNDDLFGTNVIDSMGVIELVLFIEEDLGVELNQDIMRAENFRTIEKIALIVKSADK